MMKTAPGKQQSSMGITSSPGFIFSLIVLLLNDHLLKYYFPGVITGKLSDFSGLFLTGLLVLSIRRVPVAISLLFLALLFTWWKSPFSDSLIVAWNTLALWPVQRVVDYSDLIALASLPMARYYWLSHRTLALSQLLRIPLIVATVFAVAATSLPYYFVKLDVPVPTRSNGTTNSELAPSSEIHLLNNLDEAIREAGYLPEDHCKEGTCGDVAWSSRNRIYKSRTGEAYLHVEYDISKGIATVISEDEHNYDFLYKSERLRRSLRDALVRRGYFPSEGGLVVHHPPTTYARLLITQAPGADPLNSYPYDFRRLALKTGDLLAEMGFTAVSHPDCGNNAFFAPERICTQYLAGHHNEDGGETALTSVTLAGYMLPGQPPIEISVVQFGTRAPYNGLELAHKLQDELHKAIPELAINVVTEPN